MNVPQGYAMDPLTAELVPATHLATIYANAMEEREEQARELRKLDAELADMRDALEDAAKEAPLDAGHGRKVVYDPPARGSQRVTKEGARRYKEELLTLKLGRMVEEFHPPTITEVRKNSALLVAAGVDLAVLAPEPVPGPGVLRVVTLEVAS